MKYYTPSAGDTLVMTNGDMIQVVEELKGPANTLLIRGMHVAERNDSSYPVRLPIMSSPRPYDSPQYQRNRRALIGLPCTRCGIPADTADHIIPIARGGTHEAINLRPMCGRCNSALGGHMNRGKRRRRRRWSNNGY